MRITVTIEVAAMHLYVAEAREVLSFMLIRLPHTNAETY